jgi:hypothetical protein
MPKGHISMMKRRTGMLKRKRAFLTGFLPIEHKRKRETSNSPVSLFISIKGLFSDRNP